MDEREEGEEADVPNEDDAAMMAMMGIGGFGTTKVNSVAFTVCCVYSRAHPPNTGKARRG